MKEECDEKQQEMSQVRQRGYPLREGGYQHGDGANYANFIPTGFFRSVAVHRYVCGACGFTEEWIDREDLEQLKKKYPKADHENRPL